MTEIEKLRALLAEARPILWLHRPAGDMDCDCCECSAIVKVVARIDAALAEPVARMNPYDMAVAEMRGDAWQKRAMQLERERDEARAEIERLKTESPSGDMEADVAEQRQVRGK